MSRPEVEGRPALKKGTPEWALWVAAIDVAAAPAVKQGHAFAALVPWPYVHELRDALDALGVDWRDVKRQNDEAVKARREQQAAVRAARSEQGT